MASCSPTAGPAVRAVLRPLWTERTGAAALVRTALGNFLTLDAHEREAAVVRADIATGRRRWPPSARDGALDLGPGESQYVPPAQFRIAHPACWANLPTVAAAMYRMLHGLQLMGVSEAQAKRETGLVLAQWYYVTMFLLHGTRVYYLDPVTAELLLETPLPRFPARELRMPLQGFAIALPDGRFEATVAGDPIPQPADALYVTVDTLDPDAERTISILITCRSPKGPPDDNTIHAAAHFGPDTRLEDVRIYGMGERSALGDALLRLVLGLCLYLQSEHPHLTLVTPPPAAPIRTRNPKKRRRQEARAAAASALPYVLVGGGHRETIPTGPRSAQTWRLSHEVWVAGHWRQQPYGEGRRLHRTIWIEPHRRGPDFAQAVHQRAVLVPTAEPVRERGR